MRYFELDREGRVIGDFARPQPSRVLILLEERPSRFHMRVVDAWVEDAQALNAEAARLLKLKLRERLLDEILDRDASLAAAKTAIAANRDRWLEEIKTRLRGADG